MTLQELLEVMSGIAKADEIPVTLGLLVRKDGSGHTTPATDPKIVGEIRLAKRPRLEWDTPAEGAEILTEELLRYSETDKADDPNHDQRNP